MVKPEEMLVPNENIYFYEIDLKFNKNVHKLIKYKIINSYFYLDITFFKHTVYYTVCILISSQ